MRCAVMRKFMAILRHRQKLFLQKCFDFQQNSFSILLHKALNPCFCWLLGLYDYSAKGWKSFSNVSQPIPIITQISQQKYLNTSHLTSDGRKGKAKNRQQTINFSLSSDEGFDVNQFILCNVLHIQLLHLPLNWLPVCTLLFMLLTSTEMRNHLQPL